MTLAPTVTSGRLRSIVVAALVIGTAVHVSSCSGGSTSDDRGAGTAASSTIDQTSTTAPVGPPDGAELMGLRYLEEDACFDLESDSRSLSRAAWDIPCDKPHTYEMYQIDTYEGDRSGKGALYPGTAVVQDQAERRCYDSFEAFVGVRWTISDLDIRTWWPSSESWDQNDRKILCAVTPSGASELHGTQRGSSR